MSKFRRLGLSALTVAALGAGLAGCSSSNKPSDDPNAKVTLSYAVWDKNQVPIMENLASTFTASHPNITVKVELTPWDQYWTKLKASVSGGAAPDVFWMNGPNFQLYAANGVIKPIDDQIAADKVDLTKYPKA